MINAVIFHELDHRSSGRSRSSTALEPMAYQPLHWQICRRFVKDLIGLIQLANFAFQRFHLLSLFGCDAAALAGINLDLLDPFVQCLWRTANLRGNRQARRPTALLLPGVVQNHANGTLADFRGILVRCLAHDAPPCSGVGASGKPGAVQKGFIPLYVLCGNERPGQRGYQAAHASR